MGMAMHAGDPGVDLTRRTALAAFVAAVCGCTTTPTPREGPQTLPEVPPAPPEAAAAAPTPRRANPQLSAAVNRAIEHVLAQPSDHPLVAVVDFAAHSSAPRFHLIARADGQLLQSFRVAHGHGSEGKHHDGYAELFSNVPNSNASSLGLYRTAETYISDVYPGLAMRLDGLSPTNSNARARFIVVHAAKYMEPESWMGKKGGRPGLSDGCFVFSQADRNVVISGLQGGALIYAIYEKA